MRLARGAEGMEPKLVFLHVRAGLEIETGPDALPVREGEHALLDLELVPAEGGGAVDGVHAAEQADGPGGPGDLQVALQVGAGEVVLHPHPSGGGALQCEWPDR